MAQPTLDGLLASLLEAGGFILATLFAWARFTQNVKDDLKQLQRWQEAHEMEAIKRDAQIVNLRIMAAKQQVTSENIEKSLSMISKKLREE